MVDARPLLTVFAGPNGSGKSSLQRQIVESGIALGPFVNADEIALAMRQQQQRGAASAVAQADIERAAFWAAHDRREELLKAGQSFSFETVFSHESKIELLKRARAAGYVVRLHFVSTENSRLNVARVALRVQKGGHDVPTDKIIARYRRAMQHIVMAFEHVDELVLFDNSGATMRPVVLFQRSRNGKPYVELHRPLPLWVAHTLTQLGPVMAKIAPEAES